LQNRKTLLCLRQGHREQRQANSSDGVVSSCCITSLITQECHI
jgi:hypothetical protein